MHRLSIPLSLSLLLASCATYYKNPEADPSSLAVIKNHDKENIWNPTIFAEAEKVMVYTIDGKKVSYDWSWRPGTKQILVKPGKQDLEVLVASRKSTVYRRKIARVQFVAEAGKTYGLRGSYSGPDAKFWIEDIPTKKIILPVRSIEMETVLPGSGAPMIIFLPAS
jgi:hypothetical protein